MPSNVTVQRSSLLVQTLGVRFLEFAGPLFDSFPTARVATLDKKDTLEVGLLAAAALAVLDHLFQELSKGWATKFLANPHDVDDVLRGAGRHVLRRVQWSAFKWRLGPSLFDQINAVSTLLYESSAAHGGIAIAPTSSAEKVEATCTRLFYEYSDYIPDSDWPKVVHGARQAGVRAFLYDDAPRSGEFDMHPSDFLPG
jgi:hypothetical protein